MQEFDVDPATGVGTSRFVGVLRLEELMRLAKELWGHPEFHARAYLWDLSEATLDMTSADVRRMAEFMKAGSVIRRPARMAFLMGDDLSYGLLRMFEVYREDGTMLVRAFRDRSAARAWLFEDGAP